jgi:hypothetical protein
MNSRKVWLAVVAAAVLLPAASVAGPKFDGNWNTHMACEAHGQMPAYSFDFPSTIKDNNFHGQHGEPDTAGYLLVEGRIKDDGSAKLDAKGWVSHNEAHGVFATKGNNYSYTIKAQFTDAKGTGTRNEGAGILGRPCTFEFAKQPDAPVANPQ